MTLEQDRIEKLFLEGKGTLINYASGEKNREHEDEIAQGLRISEKEKKKKKIGGSKEARER